MHLTDEELSSAVDGLQPSHVRAHVSECARCRAVLADLELIRERTGALGVLAAPPRLRARALAAMDQPEVLSASPSTAQPAGEVLETLVLKTLSWGPRDGIGVCDWLARTCADVMPVREGVVYEALHGLEARGLLVSDWVEDAGERVKRYQLTPSGQRALINAARRLNDQAAAVFRALHARS